jgi:hypothetical protein
VLALPLVVLVLAGACSDEPGVTVPSADASTGGGNVAEGVCPTIAPEPGEACLLPEGTTCAFGACGTPIAECRRGVWRYGGNPPPNPPCPAPEPPPSESACPPCWPAAVTCSYGTCTGPDASTNLAVASCPNGTWLLEFTPCAEAGADVQEDGGPDAS